jgi:hypothetical protein
MSPDYEVGANGASTGVQACFDAVTAPHRTD